jgi:hypothetical protein
MWNSYLKTHNNPIFHKIDDYSQAVNQNGSYFQVKRPTDIVIAPGSDMPFLCLKYTETEPGATDGFPAQAANPAAYVSVMDSEQYDDRHTWHPILLSHIPVTLMPGWYQPALPQIAYCSDQYDIDHGWPTDVLEWPEVMLKESNISVGISHFGFTGKAISAGSSRSWFTPWLLLVQGENQGGDMVLSNAAGGINKIASIGASNLSGSNQTATINQRILTKTRTFPDTAVVRNAQDRSNSITAIDNGNRLNRGCERYTFFKFEINVDETGATPAGIGYIIA